MGGIDRLAYLRAAANHGANANESGLKPNELGVLLAVWNYADWNTGEAYPSVERLATELGINKSTASRTLGALREKGWLELLSAGSGRGHAAVYRLALPKGCTDATNATVKVAQAQQKGCTDAQKGCTSANQLSQELNQEQSHYVPGVDPWGSPDERVASAYVKEMSN